MAYTGIAPSVDQADDAILCVVQPLMRCLGQQFAHREA